VSRLVRTVVVAVVLAALVATAQPAAAASSNLVVASEVTTESEFAAGTLTNVTTTSTGDGSIRIGETITRQEDDYVESGNTAKQGLEITPKTDLDGVSVTVSRFTSGATTAYLATSDGTVVDTAPINNGKARLTASLSADTKYHVLLDAGGSSYQIGSRSSSSYPISGGLVEITGGIDDGISATSRGFSAVDPIVSTAAYTSPNQSVSNIDAVSVGIETLENAGATVIAEYYDGSQWVAANQTTVSTAGNVTLSVSGGSENWRVRTTFTSTSGDTQGVVTDIQWQFDARAPSASSFDPKSGAEINSTNVDFSVTVSDEDFNTAQGDSVEATLFVNGVAVGSETVSSSQTVSINSALTEGGNNTYYWTLNDSYGQSTTTATKTITSPSELSIYNESNSSELLNQSTFDVTLYFDNSDDPAIVEERTVSDGTVNLTGLPAGEDFVVSVEGDGWVNRRVVVPSIYDTQRIYMLNSSVDTTPVVFKLEDFTGTFPQDETVLLVERGVNGTYQTVLGDEFGATGQFPATLATGERHRLVLLNTETGERGVAGTYTPLAGGEQTITVSPSDGVEVLDSGPTLLPATDSAELGARLQNRSATITSWEITATHVPETGTNTTLWTYAASTNGGRAVTTENLSGLSGQVILNVTYTIESGVTTSDVRVLTLQDQSDAFQFSLLGQLDSAPTSLLPDGDVDPATTAIALLLSVLSMAVVATATNTTSELTAGTGVLILGAFSVIGWVGYPLVVTSGVAWLGLTAIRRGVV